ncbi:hypothetical protein NC661_20890 [Aquibacillus koreensis]|uniref:Uncharacterized protein n=1 Tax=Aquibacillus koreensis TaxID=279446 RepID=A0A9X3WQ42_9BACI|nr:hypothetical protein [Aquibacillus koreensis]MCT2536091.1 hypothetical protein [Aquibacillus koreensis]MDC3422803.1 hypothetical protein [Aquibacillus koreensis]
MANDRDYRTLDSQFDGEKEGIISDGVGKEIGIRTENKNANNSFHVNAVKKDPDMEKFQQSLNTDKE